MPFNVFKFLVQHNLSFSGHNDPASSYSSFPAENLDYFYYRLDFLIKTAVENKLHFPVIRLSDGEYLALFDRVIQAL